MAWALLNLETIELQVGRWNEQGDYETEIIQAQPGTVCNLIVYDGGEYAPPPGYALSQVDDDKIIGDYIGL